LEASTIGAFGELLFPRGGRNDVLGFGIDFILVIRQNREEKKINILQKGKN
jgi:hypothetical protein